MCTDEMLARHNHEIDSCAEIIKIINKVQQTHVRTTHDCDMDALSLSTWGQLAGSVYVASALVGFG